MSMLRIIWPILPGGILAVLDNHGIIPNGAIPAGRAATPAVPPAGQPKQETATSRSSAVPAVLSAKEKLDPVG